MHPSNFLSTCSQDFCSNFPRHDFSFARLSSSPYLTPSLRSVAQDAISRLRGQQPAIDGDDNDGVEKEDGTFAGEDVVNDSAASAVKDPEIACNSVVEGLTLMLPLIETVMRIRFAVANGCPKRLLTAECEGEVGRLISDGSCFDCLVPSTVRLR